MGNKKKKYNARFPPARIKKIMQTDEEVGKIAAPVPVVISRALELFLESIITESVNKANESNAKTLTSSHIKTVIQSNPAFDFLKSQVSLVPDLNTEGGDASSTADKLSSHSSNHAQLPNTVGGFTDAPASAPTKKRSRPTAPSTITKEEADQSESKTPNKRKRGRPPKAKLEVKPEVKEEDGRKSTPQPTLPSPKQQPQEYINGLPKEEPLFKVEPAIATSTGEPTAVVTAPIIPSLAAAPLSYPARVEAEQAHLERELSARPRPESIFSTDNSLLYKSGYPSPAAHNSSVISRYPPSTQNVHLNYPSGDYTTSDNLRAMYNNLSPTSQPMDLSTKASSTATDLDQHRASVSATSNSHFFPSMANGEQRLYTNDSSHSQVRSGGGPSSAQSAGSDNY